MMIDNNHHKKCNDNDDFVVPLRFYERSRWVKKISSISFFDNTSKSKRIERKNKNKKKSKKKREKQEERK